MFKEGIILDTMEKVKGSESNTSFFNKEIGLIDPELAHILNLEDERQSRKLIMIASESECPAPVRMVLASSFTNIYAEGYPSRRLLKETTNVLPDMADQLSYLRRYADRRYYKGVEYADFVESLACRRAAALFTTDKYKAENIFVNVQSLSGAAANNAVYEAFVKPGDVVMGMDLTHGGHLTHGSHANRSGKNYNVVSYHADYESGEIDYKEVEELAHKHRPKLIIAGYSAYPRLIDWKRFKDIAESVGAILLADMSHIAGLVAGKSFPSPVDYADVVSFTTHKTLCGPRGAAILTTNEEYGKKIDTAVFPGEQGGPHLNSIAAKAMLFKLAAEPSFANLQKQVLLNSKALCKTFTQNGFKLAYGGSDSHMVLIETRNLKGLDGYSLRGEVASRILDSCGITCNKNTIPGDTSAVHPGALRFGTTWITQRGFLESHTEELGNIISETLKAMKPYKYIENSGEIGRAKIPVEVIESSTERVNALIKTTDANRIHGKTEYPYWLLDENKQVKKSPLYDLHIKNGAKIEEIYGYELPLYISTPDEGDMDKGFMFDACNSGIFEIRGERAAYFLDEITTTRVSRLNNGETCYTAIMNNSGRVLDSVNIAKTGENNYIMIASAFAREKLLSILRGLADGYTMFDENDIFAKIQGPAVVEDMANTSDKSKLLTNITITGKNAVDSLNNFGIASKPGKISVQNVNSAHVMTVTCPSGMACKILVHPEKAYLLWEHLSNNGLTQCGFTASEKIREKSGMPDYKKGVDALTVYDLFPQIFDMGKPYFIGQKYLNEKLPKPVTKKKFSFTEVEKPIEKTCLHAEHIKLGGRMAPFAGFDMPVWYTTINEEHNAVRTTAGLFDVSHMGILSITGNDACKFIDTIATNYSLRLFNGQSQYSYILDPDGNILDDIMVYKRTNENFIVVVNAANADKINAWITALLTDEYIVDNDSMHKDVKFDVTVKNLKDSKYGDECLVDIALQGPESQNILLKLISIESDKERFKRVNRNEFIETEICGKKAMLSRTGYTGEDYGYELYINPKDATFLWNKILTEGDEFGVKPCGLGSRDSTRTEAGLPLYGHELEGPYNVDPIEAGYGPFVKFHKAFFIGRKHVIANEKTSKMTVARFKMLNKGIKVVKQGSVLTTKRGDTIGHVTSCVIIDGIQYGLAYINKRYAQAGSKLSIFILPPSKMNEKQKDELTIGDKVSLPEEAIMLTRFPEKGEFRETYKM